MLNCNRFTLNNIIVYVSNVYIIIVDIIIVSIIIVCIISVYIIIIYIIIRIIQTMYPLLFIICINDIVKASYLFHFIMFADDTNPFASHSNLMNC